MKRIFSYTLALILLINYLSFTILATNITTLIDDPRVSTATNTRTVYANQYSGGDVGAKINAADADLGSTKGLIVYRGGGNVSTQVHLSPNHSLYIGAGTYTATVGTTPWLLNSNCEMYGDGNSTILRETTGERDRDSTVFTVITTVPQAASNGSPTQNITIRDLQIQGARSDFYSANPAVGLGNLHHGRVRNVNLNSTHSIGIQAGAASTLGDDPLKLGRYAEDVTVEDCRFEKVASQNLAIVNGKNITFKNNFFLNPSQAGGPGVTAIDAEVNQSTDLMENINIVHNKLDARNSALSPHGNFIAYQPNATSGPATIAYNEAVSDYHSSNGIILNGNARDVEISHNIISGMGQCGLNLNGTRLSVFSNQLSNTGTGGVVSLRVEATNSKFSDNILKSTTNGSDSIVEYGAADYNTYSNNVAKNGIGLVGAHSKIISVNMTGGKNHSQTRPSQSCTKRRPSKRVNSC